jgi:RNA polymerase sigma factor (TIGR02999 family)
MQDQGPAVTALLRSWEDGEAAALHAVTEALYAQLRAVAGSHLAREAPGHTLQATALVHEAYLRMQGKAIQGCRDRKHFLAIASRVMRCILVDHARAQKRQKRDGGHQVTLHEFAACTDDRAGVIEIHEALDKLAGIDARKVRAIELVSFAGASYSEAAEIMEISEATLHRDLKMARAWLKAELRQAA